MMKDKLLRIYLNDHLAMTTVGRELAKRCLSNNETTSLGKFLQDLLTEIEEDISTLEQVMRGLHFRIDPLKRAAAWTAEKAGRLKLNGRLRGYSDLSRLLELEGLYILLESKITLWRTLLHISASDPRLALFDFDELVKRAERQKADLDGHRQGAVHTVFAIEAP